MKSLIQSLLVAATIILPMPNHAASIECGPGTQLEKRGGRRVLEQWCEIASLKGARHGPYVRYEWGRRVEEGSYALDEKDGIWLQWHYNGQIKTQRGYKDGKLHGLNRRWFNNGDVKSSESIYVEGQRHGLSQTWYEDGQFRTVMNFDNGKKHGFFHRWYRDGQAAERGRFLKNKKDGDWFTWRKSGERQAITSYDKGRRDGPYLAWYRNGERREAGRFIKGRRGGEWVYWYNNGQKMGEGQYRYGRLTNRVKMWWRDGEAVAKRGSRKRRALMLAIAETR